jgi:hypothetical protein
VGGMFAEAAQPASAQAANSDARRVASRLEYWFFISKIIQTKVQGLKLRLAKKSSN